MYRDQGTSKYRSIHKYFTAVVKIKSRKLPRNTTFETNCSGINRLPNWWLMTKFKYIILKALPFNQETNKNNK